MAHVSFEGVCCADCVQPVANGDFSSLDYYYQQEESDRRYKRIVQGMDDLCKEHKGYLIYGELVSEFSRDRCDVCNASHAGEWHSVLVLSS